mgnify:CR=1 FL=1
MTLEGVHYRYESGALVRTDALLDEVHLAAADSWLVADGKVRSLGAHFARFSSWVEKAAPELVRDLPQFFQCVTDALPLEGRWFPRIELHLDEPALYLRLRTAPEQLGAAVLWTLDETDPRLQPTVKGPDLSLCMQLRRKANLHGADEAVLLTDAGYVSEGALAALVWWRGDVLCAPALDIPWIDSITRNEIFDIAKQSGIETRLENVKPGDLAGLEIWLLSSLQGIRPVSEWINLGAQVGKATHFEAFQKRLRLLATQVQR